MHRRPLTVLALACATVLTVTGPALAAPGNDGYAGRTAIGVLPYTAIADTSEATTDAHDAALNAACFAPATDASVWYEWTAPSDMSVVVDVSESDYSAGVLVGVGAPGSLELVNCAGGAVSFYAEAGQTYLFLAIDDKVDESGSGGTLQMTVAEAPPAPTIDVHVNPIARYDAATGGATVTGRVLCEGEEAAAGVDVELTQPRDDGVVVRGWGLTDVPCDGQRHDWSVEVEPESGSFQVGKAVNVTFGTACGPYDCGTDYVEHTVWLVKPSAS